jgi:hypothetical protein
MYGYKELSPLTSEDILNEVSEEDIFKIIIKEPILKDKGALYRAPYREDSNPDCYFENYNGVLSFVDFADYQSSKNCFMFLQRVLKLTHNEVLQYVYGHFNLGSGDGKFRLKDKQENDHVEEEKLVKSFKERTITYLPREFGYKDKKFWSQYGISRENLIKDGVIPIQMYRSMSKHGKYFTIACMDEAYAYTKFTTLKGKLKPGKVKIYRPYAVKEAKWFTNCNQNDVGGLESLPEKGDLLLITKAYKDCRIALNFKIISCWFQAEGIFPNKEILLNLCIRFKKIIIWFDNDSTGIAHSARLVSLINSLVPDKASLMMIPPKLLKESVKDLSDFYAKKGKEETIKFLTERGITIKI